MREMENLGIAAKRSARKLAYLSGDKRNAAIKNIADRLLSSTNKILNENKKDVSKGRTKGLSEAILDRLLLTPERIDIMASDALKVAALSDWT